jgi:hypothetical protein
VYELEEIMGVFEIDDQGNTLVDRDRMQDDHGRDVNLKGYLTDQWGNIINNKGEVIYERDELQTDGEIPLVDIFNIRKKQLMDEKYRFQIDKNDPSIGYNDSIDQILQDEETQVETEFN